MHFVHKILPCLALICTSVAVRQQTEDLGNDVTENNGQQPPQPSSDSCVTCQKNRLSVEEMHLKKIEQEKQKILAKLKFQDPPNVVVDQWDIPSVLRKRMAEEFSKTNAFDPDEDEGVDEDIDVYGKTKGFYIFGEHPKRGWAKSLQCMTKDGRTAACVDFKLSHDITTKEIVNASLWLYKLPGTNPVTSDNADYSDVIKIVEIHRHHSRLTPDEELVDEITTTVQEGWIEVEVGHVVESWRHRKNPDRKHQTLQISCPTCSMTSVHPPVATTYDERPFLDIKTGVSKNRRRRSNLCLPELYSNCCLKPFYVNFTEIGWNTWIIQPPGYYANYCTGSCRTSATTPYNSVLKTAAMTKEVHGETFDKGMIPCCSPTRMSPLSILYAFTAGEIRKKVLDNMIVKSCGC